MNGTNVSTELNTSSKNVSEEILKSNHYMFMNKFIKPVPAIVCFLGFIIMLPVVIIFMLTGWIYRIFARYWLKRKYAEKFIKFLSGSDALYALHEDDSKFVINIMAFVEIKRDDYLDKNRNIINENLLKTRDRLGHPNLVQKYPKLFYKLNKELGYCFWTNDNECKIEDYIRLVPIKIDHGSDVKTRIQQTFSDICNSSLPLNHTATWEMLISGETIDNGDVSADGEPVIFLPIMYRFHHVMGDGVSILRFILEEVIDKEVEKEGIGKTEIHLNPPTSSFTKTKLTIESIGYIIDFLKMYSILFYKILIILFYTPACLLKSMKFSDENDIHPSKVGETKTIAWYFEKDEDSNLMEQIKFIRKQIPGARFSDIILLAISNTLEVYCREKKLSIPHKISMLSTVRIAPINPEIEFENKFSTVPQDVPIKTEEYQSKKLSYYNKINEIKVSTDFVRHTPILLIIYWVVYILAVVLPKPIVVFVIKSILNSSVLITNLPGPVKHVKVQNFLIRYVTFMLPNPGSTGLGFSILSYNGKIQLGFIGDRSIISDVKDADFILETIVQQIKYQSEIFKKLS